MSPVIRYGLLLPLLMFAAACQRNQPLTEQDRAVILRAGDLANFGFAIDRPERFEKFDKQRWFDFSTELNYEFETPDAAEQSLYINITVGKEVKVTDAVMQLAATRVGMFVGLKSSGISHRQIEGFHAYGDSAEFYSLEMNGNPIGNAYLMRQGKIVYALVLSGLYVDDPAVWAEMIEPRLRQLDKL